MRPDDPEDDEVALHMIFETTYFRAKEVNPELTQEIVIRYRGQERLQWLQNIADGTI